jgi:4-amino-4-deoxy-L-arabinose transferase-like glycosyltransferase
MFLFFSVAVSKLAPYILPLFPAAALLVALLWEDLLSTPAADVRKIFVWSLMPAFVLMVAVAVYVWFRPPVSLEAKYGMSMIQVHTLSLSSVLALALALGAVVAHRYRLAMATIVGLVACVLVVFVVSIAPAMDPYRSTKDLALELDRMLPPGEEIAFFKRLKDSALFYTDRYGRVVRTAADLEAHFSTDRKVYCVVDTRHRDRLQGLEEEFPIALERANKVILTNSNTARAARAGG